MIGPAARKTGWVIMTTLATIIAAYALAVAFIPGFGPPFVQERRLSIPLALYGHLVGSAVALGLGAWQFNTRLRARALNVHRSMGRVYVSSVLVGGCSGLALAVRSLLGPMTHLGFAGLAVFWLATTIQAYRMIRRLDIVAHRAWMIRSYALTLAAVTLRIYLPISLAAGVPFVNAYPVISWACWVPNLLLAEWWFVPRMRAMPIPEPGGQPSAA